MSARLFLPLLASGAGSSARTEMASRNGAFWLLQNINFTCPEEEAAVICSRHLMDSGVHTLLQHEVEISAKMPFYRCTVHPTGKYTRAGKLKKIMFK